MEINTIRKCLPRVKGGRFAQLCAPVQVFSEVLSDIWGDPPDMVASGPACPDRFTCREAQEIAARYRLHLSDAVRQLLEQETPKAPENVESHVVDSVREQYLAASEACWHLGYRPFLLTDLLSCQAREASSFLDSIVRTHSVADVPLAFVTGGGTVVRLSGSGKGDRIRRSPWPLRKGALGYPMC